MNDHQFKDLYNPVNQGYMKHKQKHYSEWNDDRVYTEELFWDKLVQLGWRQHHKEHKINNKINLILQLVLECPSCEKAIKTVHASRIGMGSVTVMELLVADLEIEKHQKAYCKGKAIPEEIDELL